MEIVIIARENLFFATIKPDEARRNKKTNSIPELEEE